MSNLFETATFRAMSRNENIANEFTIMFRQMYSGNTIELGIQGFVELKGLSLEQAAPFEPGKFFQLKLVEVGDPTDFSAHERTQKQDGSTIHFGIPPDAEPIEANSFNE